MNPTANLHLDGVTPFAVPLVNRLRQPSLWIPPLAVASLYFISNSIHTTRRSPGATSSADMVCATLLLAWLVAASGTRDPAGPEWALTFNCSASTSLRRLFFDSLAVAGQAAADALSGMGGSLLLALAPSLSWGSVSRGLPLVVVTAPVFVAASLQMGLARQFADRSIALIVTALVTVATLIHGTNASTLGLDRVGGLLFPVSSVLRAAEEPLGLELAARAVSAGVLYDLALFAALLALRPIRARGFHADRDRQ